MESRSKKIFLILITNIYFFLVSVRSGFFFFFPNIKNIEGEKLILKKGRSCWAVKWNEIDKVNICTTCTAVK